MGSENAKRKILELALKQAGGLAKLAEQLALRESVLRHYVDGGLAVPDALYLRLLDLVQARP
jgi:hypothetical protein